MKISLVSAVALAVLVIGGTAGAQTPAPAPAAPKPAARTAPATPATPTTPTTVVQTKDYTEQRVDGGSVVTFPGDELPGDPNDPYGGLVRSPPRVIKVGLIRPRMNFVPELLKSVENL